MIFAISASSIKNLIILQIILKNSRISWWYISWLHDILFIFIFLLYITFIKVDWVGFMFILLLTYFDLLCIKYLTYIFLIPGKSTHMPFPLHRLVSSRKIYILEFRYLMWTNTSFALFCQESDKMWHTDAASQIPNIRNIRTFPLK